VEEDLYREKLHERLAAQGLSEAQRSLRVARALRTFSEEVPRREAVYAGIASLAGAAIELHEFLVRHEGEISYEPAEVGVSREPVTEAVPENRRVGEEMNLALDRLFLALEATHGSRVAPRLELPLLLRRGLTGEAAAP
jgi:hypothetical protein